jgi:PAS domain S-box-containing protein
MATGERLRAGEKKDDSCFEAILKIEPECVKLIDETGRILLMNPAGLSILEAVSPHEVVGRSMLDFVIPAQHDQLKGYLAELLRRDSVTCEFEVVGLKGGHRWLESHMMVVRNATQKIEVLAVTRDVTKPRLTESALRESEERFRQLAQHIQEVFWMFDRANNALLYISPAYERIFARSCESLYLSSNFWLNSVHPEDQAQVSAALWGQTPADELDIEYRIVRPDGETRWVHHRTFPVLDQNGQVYRIAGIATDITQRREVENAHALTEAKLRQAQKMEALGTLAGGIAHDFNNILCAIIGNLELARMDLPAGSAVWERVEDTLKAAGRASDLVRQILFFSRQTDEEKRIINVAPIVKEVARLLRAALPSTIEQRLSLPSPLPQIMADPAQIHQVLMNLATNSAYAMRRNGGDLSISVSAVNSPDLNLLAPLEQPAGSFLRVAVTDTGEGMEPSLLEKIFEPFFTTKPPGEGTGLGLSVVQGIVKAHNGWISVTSTPGMGSSFEIYFPAVEKLPEADSDFQNIPMGNGEKIMIVDDEAAVCSLIKRSAPRCGYEPVVFSTSEEALDHFRNNWQSISAVVTDLTMPGMTGFDLVREIHRISPPTPVILMSGFVSDIGEEAQHSLGIYSILPKPFSIASLCGFLQRAIQTAPSGKLTPNERPVVNDLKSNGSGH